MIRKSHIILAAVAALFAAGASAQTKIAFTFDDLPAHSTLPPGVTRMDVATSIISALKAAQTPPVYGFVNAIRMQEDIGTIHVLEAWRAAGFPLGSHTWSHMDLNKHTLAEWQADTLRDEPALQQQMPTADWHWLRFPFLSEGDTPEKRSATRAFLHARDYRIAAVTLSFGDYAYNEPYARCVAQHDDAAIAKMETAYLAGAKQTLDQARTMSQTLLQREIPFVLLMHLGAFDARMLPRLIAFYKSEGVDFVSLQQAESDPYYRADTDLSLPYEPDSLAARLGAARLPIPQGGEALPAFLNTVCR
jgi:peptidoglycan/xylan/chitin deacetylase (PgdA/CDA1 family)